MLSNFCAIFAICLSCSFSNFHPRLVSRPSIGGSILLQVTEGVDGIGEPEFCVLHTQCVWAQGDDIRQAGDQCCGRDFEVGFDAARERGFLLVDASQRLERIHVHCETFFIISRELLLDTPGNSKKKKQEQLLTEETLSHLLSQSHDFEFGLLLNLVRWT